MKNQINKQIRKLLESGDVEKAMNAMERVGLNVSTQRYRWNTSLTKEDKNQIVQTLFSMLDDAPKSKPLRTGYPSEFKSLNHYLEQVTINGTQRVTDSNINISGGKATLDICIKSHNSTSYMSYVIDSDHFLIIKK